jgi:hypothetical protein
MSAANFRRAWSIKNDDGAFDTKRKDGKMRLRCLAGKGAKFSHLFNQLIFGYGGLAMNEHRSLTVAELYPELSKEEMDTAAENIRRYLAVLLHMAERLEAEGKTINDLAVDCSFDDGADKL